MIGKTNAISGSAELKFASGTMASGSNTMLGLDFTPYVVGVRLGFGIVEARNSEHAKVFSYHQRASFTTDSDGNIDMFEGGFTLITAGAAMGGGFPWVAYGY